ncbi:MAG: hypothetical protein JRH20_21470 [Deltaproteobacteria bacterium]|nr:hypothetical protein [Deltaproteobacteria bacterium]
MQTKKDRTSTCNKALPEKASPLEEGMLNVLSLKRLIHDKNLSGLRADVLGYALHLHDVTKTNVQYIAGTWAKRWTDPRGRKYRSPIAMKGFIVAPSNEISRVGWRDGVRNEKFINEAESAIAMKAPLSLYFLRKRDRPAWYMQEAWPSVLGNPKVAWMSRDSQEVQIEKVPPTELAKIPRQLEDSRTENVAQPNSLEWARITGSPGSPANGMIPPPYAHEVGRYIDSDKVKKLGSFAAVANGRQSFKAPSKSLWEKALSPSTALGLRLKRTSAFLNLAEREGTLRIEIRFPGSDGLRATAYELDGREIIRNLHNLIVSDPFAYLGDSIRDTPLKVRNLNGNRKTEIMLSRLMSYGRDKVEYGISLDGLSESLLQKLNIVGKSRRAATIRAEVVLVGQKTGREYTASDLFLDVKAEARSQL